jgi:GT2 family glycosyltransferase
MSTVILVPRRADNDWRDKLWNFARKHWEELGFDIVEGDHNEGPFNRSAAINTAARLAGDWDTAIVIDSDVIVNLNVVRDGITVSNEMDRIVFPFRVRQTLNHGMTSRILSGYNGSWVAGIKGSFHDNLSSCLVVPRSVWDAVGGFDERFIGWGWEDVAFKIAADTMAGNAMRLPGDLWHLWHHTSPENNHSSPLFLANRDLCHRYIERRHSRSLMEEILNEDGAPLS